MRNRYKGTCYRCGLEVAAGDGHFERYKGKWLTQHATCAILYRSTEIKTTFVPNLVTPTNKIVRK